MPSHEAALIQEARRLARLQAKQTRLKRELREVAAELRQARRNLKALAQGTRDPFQQAPPIKGLDTE